MSCNFFIKKITKVKINMNYTIEYNSAASDINSNNNYMRINKFTFKTESSEVSLTPVDIINLINTVEKQS